MAVMMVGGRAVERVVKWGALKVERMVYLKVVMMDSQKVLTRVDWMVGRMA